MYTNIRIKLYFRDDSSMVLDSFEEARECIQAYLAFSQDRYITLTDADTLTNASYVGLTQAQEDYLKSQIERILPSINLGVNHD
jgi:hypothetical protein